MEAWGIDVEIDERKNVDSSERKLRHAAAPSLPLSYIKQIDGSAIELEEGPCASAAFRNEPDCGLRLRVDGLEEKRHGNARL
jgi:hypothetical protein